MGMNMLKIGDVVMGEGLPPVVVAEVGINHEGSVARALQMVESAHQQGADVVKFQTHIPEAEMVRTSVVPEGISQESLWDIIERCSLSAEQEREVAALAADLGIQFLSTPFSPQAVDRLMELGVSGFKIGSGEVSHRFLIERVADCGLPVIMSTGMHSIDEIGAAVETLKAGNCPVALLHCVSAYPAKHSDMALGRIQTLKQSFRGLPIGLSDHSVGNWCAFASVALGAVAVEKHFTLSRDWPGPDMPVSMEPTELRDLVVGCRAVWEATQQDEVAHGLDLPVRAFARASIVAARPIAPGEKIQWSDLALKRPGSGELHAADLDRVLGCRALRPISKDDFLAEGDFSWSESEL